MGHTVFTNKNMDRPNKVIRDSQIFRPMRQCTGCDKKHKILYKYDGQGWFCNMKCWIAYNDKRYGDTSWRRSIFWHRKQTKMNKV